LFPIHCFPTPPKVLCIFDGLSLVSYSLFFSRTNFFRMNLFRVRYPSSISFSSVHPLAHQLDTFFNNFFPVVMPPLPPFASYSRFFEPCLFWRCASLTFFFFWLAFALFFDFLVVRFFFFLSCPWPKSRYSKTFMSETDFCGVSTCHCWVVFCLVRFS